MGAAGLNTGFAVIQVIVGLAIGSVVVLADAAHQIVDALGLLTALGAALLAARPSSDEMSYGWGKADALGGFVSGLLLLGSIVWITWESIARLFDPVAVEGGSVILIGVIAVAVNGLSVLALSQAGIAHTHAGHTHAHGHDSHGHDSHDHDHEPHGPEQGRRGDPHLAIRAARLHLLIDLAGSFLVVFAGVLLRGTSWTWIDPVASLALSLLVLRSTWHLMRAATHELLDRAPASVTIEAVTSTLNSQAGVERVHHVHVRPLGQQRTSVTAHVVVDGEQSLHDAQAHVGALTSVLERDLGVAHTTIQLECHPCEDDDC